MFAFNKNKRIEVEREELEQKMVAQAFEFTTSVTEAFESFIGEKGERPYRLLVSKVSPTDKRSPLNQFILISEHLAFSLHCLDRAAFRRDDTRLTEIIFEATERRIASLLTKISESIETEISEDRVLEFLESRQVLYAQMPSILGKGTDDPQSVYTVARKTIGTAFGHPGHFFLDANIRNPLHLGRRQVLHSV